jgi:hypothetical protein
MKRRKKNNKETNINKKTKFSRGQKSKRKSRKSMVQIDGSKKTGPK